MNKVSLSKYYQNSTSNSNEAVLEVVIHGCPLLPENFLVHNFKVCVDLDNTTLKNVNIQKYWELKDLTANQTIDSGTVEDLVNKTMGFLWKRIEYHSCCHMHTLRFRLWLSSGTFESCVLKLCSLSVYNESPRCLNCT